MSNNYTVRLFAFVLLVTSTIGFQLRIELSSRVVNSSAQQARIKIGQETTYLTEPITTDGEIDYLRALAQPYVSELDHDENCALPLLARLGPSSLSGVPEEILKSLEVEWVRNDDLFVPIWKYADQLSSDDTDEFLQECNRASCHEWNANELPRLGAWLEDQMDNLDEIVRLLRSRKLIAPVYCPEGDDSPLRTIRMIGQEVYLSLARSLCIRSNYFMHRDEFGLAWQDILAVYRLARHASFGPGAFAQWNAIYIDRMANFAAVRLMNRLVAMNDFYEEIQIDLRELRSFAPLEETLGFTERLFFIDSVIRLSNPSGDFEFEKTVFHISDEWVQDLRSANLNWNDVISESNSNWDRLVDNLELNDWEEREDTFYRELERFEETIPTESNDLSTILDEMRQDNGKVESYVSRMLLGLMIEDFAALDASRIVARSQQETLSIAVAIQRYFLELGEYPSSLYDLEPEFISTVPMDAFSNQPFKYLSSPYGFSVYSVGIDGADQGGPDLEDFGDSQSRIRRSIDDIGVIVSSRADSN